MMAEGAGVCLEWHGHEPGIPFRVRGEKESLYSISWTPISFQARRLSWAAPDDAVEPGAVGIAALLIVAETGLTTIERSLKGTGIDYWLGHESGDAPFQRRARLEVSGILSGSESDIRTRMSEKLKQTK